MKVRKGDSVIVISGPERGKTGKVSQVYPSTQRVLIDGINLRIKHQKKTGNQPGRIDKLPMPIHVSNVNPVGMKDKPSRVGYKIDQKGKKVRVLRQAGNKELKS